MDESLYFDPSPEDEETFDIPRVISRGQMSTYQRDLWELSSEFFLSEEPSQPVPDVSPDSDSLPVSANSEISSSAVVFQVRWRGNLSHLEEGMQDEEPTHPSSLEREFLLIAEILAGRYERLLLTFVHFRREHKKVKAVSVAYLQHIIIPSYFTQGGFPSQDFMRVAESVLQHFLNSVLALEDFTQVQTVSLRHKSMGCLVDCFTVFSYLLRDFAALHQRLCGTEAKQKWKLLFLSHILQHDTLYDVCERAENCSSATSQAAECLKRIYLDLKQDSS